MVEFNNEFISFCENSGFYVDDKQKCVISKIFENIDNGKIIQIVLMPNATGKTNLSLLLSCFMTKKEKNIVRYAPMESPNEFLYLPYIKSNKDLLDKIEQTNAGTIIQQYKKGMVCDWVIADGLAFTDISKLNKESIADKLGNLFNDNMECEKYLSQSDLEWLGQTYLAKMIAAAKSGIIIFMKKSELELCKKTVFLLSNKKCIVDVYNDIEVDRIDNNTTENIHKSFKSVINEFKQYFDDRMDRVESKIDSISDKVNEMHKIMNSLNNKVSVQKEVISSYVDIVDNEESIECFLESVLNRLTKQLNEEILQYEKFNSFQQYKQLVKIRMGVEAWDKMSEASRRFLVTSKFSFAENVLLGDEIDYSSICLLASKAFEIELSRRLINDYVEYLKDCYENDYDKWPPIMIKEDKNGNLVPLDVEDFTLGKCPYIMGLYSKDKKAKIINAKMFRDYCKSVLLKDADLSDLDNILVKFNSQINIVREKYRNPAAHKDCIGMLEASKCIDYILEVEKVLKMMLESFNK